MNKKANSLRARKRHETRQALETATIELVSNFGLEKTTIEAISDRANVSARTFFNYFDSKEDALLGVHNITLTDDEIAACADQHSNDTVPAMLIRLIVRHTGPLLTNRELYATRRRIIKQYPELLERQMNRIVHISRKIITTTQQLAASRKQIELSDSEAEVLIAACMSSVRVTIRNWIVSHADVSVTKLEKEAISTLNETVRKIQ